MFVFFIRDAWEAFRATPPPLVAQIMENEEDENEEGEESCTRVFFIPSVGIGMRFRTIEASEESAHPYDGDACCTRKLSSSSKRVCSKESVVNTASCVLDCM